MWDDELFHEFIGVYSLCLIIIGLVLNIICICICLTKSLRIIPTFLLIAFLLVFDTISLCFWNIDHYLHQFHDYTIEDISIVSCRLETFFQCFSLQSSSWILVAISVETYLSVRLKHWRMTFITAKKTALLCFVIISIIFCINIHLVFSIEFNPDLNATQLGRCMTSYIYQNWMQFHIYIYSIIPFAILIVANGLLIMQILKKKANTVGTTTRGSRASKHKALTITVMSIASLFLFLTLPQAVVRGYFIYELSGSPAGISVLFFTDCIGFTFHAIQFFILSFTNKKFFKELSRVLKFDKSRVNATTDGQMSTSLQQ